MPVVFYSIHVPCHYRLRRWPKLISLTDIFGHWLHKLTGVFPQGRFFCSFLMRKPAQLMTMKFALTTAMWAWKLTETGLSNSGSECRRKCDSSNFTRKPRCYTTVGIEILRCKFVFYTTNAFKSNIFMVALYSFVILERVHSHLIGASLGFVSSVYPSYTQICYML